MSEQPEQNSHDQVDQVEEDVVEQDEPPNQDPPAQELQSSSGKTFSSISQYPIELKNTLGHLGLKKKKEAKEEKRYYEPKKGAWIKVRKEGFASLAVREYFDDLRNAAYNDPQFRKAVEMTNRAMKRLEQSDEDFDLPAPKKQKRIRAEGGGRKAQAIDFRNELFAWFVDVRFVLKGRLPKKLFVTKAKELYNLWLENQPEIVPPEKQLQFTNPWVYGWMKEFGVSLRKPNKRFAISQEDRVERIEEYIMNILIIRKFFWDKFGIIIPIYNGDQMPIHRNESHGVKTFNFKNQDTFVKENYMLSRERITCFTTVCSDPKIKIKPEFVFKGKGKQQLLCSF